MHLARAGSNGTNWLERNQAVIAPPGCGGCRAPSPPPPPCRVVAAADAAAAADRPQAAERPPKWAHGGPNGAMGVECEAPCGRVPIGAQLGPCWAKYNGLGPIYVQKCAIT
jgi:hypothetical protein